ncbi:alcohol dehydrogenase [candidate division MSBL1 archaeon SCGC-AAA261F19]|uniref:Alcohol dehydrogenase n=1 Tax=candidate division MSBL1 archaeon SCGC-AAA261F19 TaxID=1698275 RepID=A0A133V8G4_9EURY|nr:alcohol dehydrogenase [candidate division MSBL1 archaeon SCGC-AAA261F19]
MKAMQLKEPKPVEQAPLEMVELKEPRPGPKEVKIDVQACGVCHTDLHTVEGELSLPKLPIVPGHEVVGVVEESGDEAEHFEVGDRVGVTWLYSSCGECKFCRRGQENLCEDPMFTGLHADGGYEESMVAKEDFVYPIPKNISDEDAAPLLCAGVIGYRSLRLSEVKPGQRLGLFGFGASAHIVIQLATDMGCEVYVFTRSEEHRRLARELGSAWEGSAKDDPPHRIDSGITFAPVGWIVKEALRDLEKGGTLAINAIHMTPIPELDYDLIYHEKKLRSVANVTREDAEGFLKIAGDIPVQTEVETFPLEEANRALRLLKDSKINGAGVLKVS